jgi:hypothetical protein
LYLALSDGTLAAFSFYPVSLSYNTSPFTLLHLFSLGPLIVDLSISGDSLLACTPDSLYLIKDHLCTPVKDVSSIQQTLCGQYLLHENNTIIEVEKITHNIS